MVPRKPEIDLINVMVCRYFIVLILSACVSGGRIYSVLYGAGCKYSCQTPPFHLQKYEQTLKYGFYLQEIWPPFCFLPQMAALSLPLPAAPHISAHTICRYEALELLAGAIEDVDVNFSLYSGHTSVGRELPEEEVYVRFVFTIACNPHLIT